MRSLAAAAALVTAAGIWGATRGGEQAGRPTASVVPSDPPVAAVSPAPVPAGEEGAEPRPVGFDGRTDVALLFDAGADRGLVVDLDSGAQRELRLPGQRAGDQPFRLWKLGGWVVVGWGEIWAVTPGGQQPARKLGDATLFVPHADPRQLWLVDHGEDRAGGRGGTWTLIDAAGDTLAEVEVEGADVHPLRGVPGGLAVRRADGSLARHDLELGRLVDYLGDGPAWIGDVTATRVAWCDQDPCRRLVVADEQGATVATLGRGETFSRDRVWLSGDGSRIAVGVAVDVGGGVDLRLRVYDVDSGDLLADRQTPLGRLHGAWTDDGRQFFASLQLPGTASAPAVLSRWAGGDVIRSVDVRQHGITGVHGFVTLPSHAVRAPRAPAGRGR